MARPKSDDPSVPIPVRVPRSVLDRLRREAVDGGESLSSLVRRRVDPGLDAPRRPRDPRNPASYGTERLDKTERVDLRAGAPVCECEKPTLSKVAPICTTCGRRR